MKKKVNLAILNLMAEQGESFLNQKEKITPKDVKDLAYHLDDYFLGINPKDKPVENENLTKEQEKWGGIS